MIINSTREIRYSKKKRPDESSVFEYLNKTLMKSTTPSRESKLGSSIAINENLEINKCTIIGQTYYFIVRNCEELSPSLVMLRILSQFTVTNNECYQKKSTLLYKKTQKTKYWDDRGEILKCDN